MGHAASTATSRTPDERANTQSFLVIKNLRRLSMKQSLYALILFVGVALIAACQTALPTGPRADWADVTVETTGTGHLTAPLPWPAEARLSAIRNAKADAYAKMEFQIMALSTAPGETVLQRVGGDAARRRQVAAFVRGAQILEMKPRPHGIEVAMRLYLGEGFRTILGLGHKKPTPPHHNPPTLTQ